MNKRLERNQEYDVKLTGEEIALIKGILGNYTGSILTPMWNKFRGLVGNIMLDTPVIDMYSESANIDKYLCAVFKPIETEDKRKLRELKEQYAKLGDSIAAMEKK